MGVLRKSVNLTNLPDGGSEEECKPVNLLDGGSEEECKPNKSSRWGF